MYKRQLLAQEGAEGDAFGASVAISGDVIVVGASGHDGLASNAGAAYTFVRSDGDWIPQATLLRPGGGADERFGTAVAVDGAVAVVGGVNATTARGTATVFRAPLP